MCNSVSIKRIKRPLMKPIYIFISNKEDIDKFKTDKEIQKKFIQPGTS